MPSDDDPKPLGGIGHDALAGLAVAAVACLAIYKVMATDIGTLAEIGPGLFPMALAAILLALSLVLGLRGLMQAQQKAVSRPGWPLARALAGILGALAVFGLAMKGATAGPFSLPAMGLAGAIPLAVLTAGLANPDTRWGSLVALALALTVFCILLFRFALGLPLPLAPWLVGY